MPAQQKVTKKRLPLRTAFAALRFPRSDGAGGSKAKARRDLPVGAKPCSRCRACEAAIDRAAGAGISKPQKDLRSYRSLARARQRLQAWGVREARKLIATH
ncbi:hypothetical protein EMIT0373P_60537 [Pseudomonas chlororaphis]